MSPDERRIVHVTLTDDPHVDTESQGEGYFKRVKIFPV
jgi:predicted RNA-binding protein Jag